ncbi:MAG: 13E12 repeat family protein [Microthrixaceae bacterium]|nr:13E12 repeat family protein [Microthrixaceae bacterium]
MITTARVLAGVDAKELSDEECLGMVDDIEAARRSLDAASAGVLAEVDRRGLCDIRYGTATGVWFERRHGRSHTAVNREIRAGRRLRADLDDVFTALARGEITFERAAFIAARVNDRNADAFGAAQHALLALSDAEPGWSRFTALVDDLARYADADGGHDPTEQQSKVSMRRSADELVIDATLCGSEGFLRRTPRNRDEPHVAPDQPRPPAVPGARDANQNPDPCPSPGRAHPPRCHNQARQHNLDGHRDEPGHRHRPNR